MKVKHPNTWDPKLDILSVWYLIVPSAILSCIFRYNGNVIVESLWAFSIYLEAVAILPQLAQMTKTGQAETITTHYLVALGGYRALYLMHWIYRYMSEYNFHDWISVIAGTVQTLLYADFFYIYVTRF